MLESSLAASRNVLIGYRRRMKHKEDRDPFLLKVAKIELPHKFARAALLQSLAVEIVFQYEVLVGAWK